MCVFAVRSWHIIIHLDVVLNTGIFLTRTVFSVQFLGARSYSTHDTLVITDGQSNCGADILTSSRTLQQRSNVYALAIGLSSDRAAASEITSLVSNRDPRHLFSLANFRDFQDMIQNVRNRKSANQCQQIVNN